MSIDQTDSNTMGAKSMEPVINNFNITVATVNGSGSQTSNLTLETGMPILNNARIRVRLDV